MHVCLGGVGWPATTSAASSSRCSTACSAGRSARGSSRRCARSAAWCTASTRSPACTRRPASTGLYFGCRPERLEAVMETVGRELVRLVSEPVPEDELQRAKEHLKGRMILGLESTSSRMTRLGKGVLTDTEILSLDELAARIEAVTPSRCWSWRPRSTGRRGCRWWASAPTSAQFDGVGAGGLPGRPRLTDGGADVTWTTPADQGGGLRRRWAAWAARHLRGRGRRRATCSWWRAVDPASTARRRGRLRRAAGEDFAATCEHRPGRGADVDVVVDFTVPASVRGERPHLPRAPGGGGGGDDGPRRRRPGRDRRRRPNGRRRPCWWRPTSPWARCS